LERFFVRLRIFFRLVGILIDLGIRNPAAYGLPISGGRVDIMFLRW